MDRVRHELAVAAADYAYRDAARQEELRVYELAELRERGGCRAPAAARDRCATPARGRDRRPALAVHPCGHRPVLPGQRRTSRIAYADAEPVASLRVVLPGGAAASYGVDASYLASINFIESNFGRVNGPSSAGALGPDAVPAGHVGGLRGGRQHHATRTTRSWPRRATWSTTARRTTCATRSGTTTSTSTTSTRSSPSPAPIRADPAWLDRMYYWNTYGRLGDRSDPADASALE